MTDMRQAGLRWQWLSVLAIIAGLAAPASASEWDAGGVFARWSPADEITSLRTENSKMFDNHDGTRSVVIAGPMHWQVAPGVWADPSDTTVVVDTGEVDDDGMWWSLWSFFCCQHIYLASELNFAGTIRNVAFYTDDACPPETMLRSHQFLGNTADTCFTSYGWGNAGTEVWTGDLIRDDTGWLDLPLQVRFFHPGDSNLVVSYRHTDSTGHLRAYRRYHGTQYDSAGCRSKRGQSAEDTLPWMIPSQVRVNIMITYEPALVDAEVESILAPADSILWGRPCVPRAVVRNNGVIPATFPVRFSISDGYVATDTVTGLSPGAEDTVTFPPWTPDSAGRLVAKCSTCLTHDQLPGNNRMADTVFVVYHDVGVRHIVVPTGIVPLGDSVAPDVMLHNYGTATENPWLVVEILRSGSPVYAESVLQPVNAHDSIEVLLPRYWHADSLGNYDVCAWTTLPGDINHSNDTAHGSFQVQNLPLHDVGAIQILAPKDSVAQDSIVQPQAIVRNFGRSSENVPVSFTIARSDTLVYCDTADRMLPAGTTDTVRTFQPCTLDVSGSYRTCCRTCLSSDMDSTNDAVSDSFFVTRRLRHDIGVSAIVAPSGSIDSGETITPTAQIRNLGDFSQSGTVRFSISDSPPYRCSVLVTSLPPDSMRVITFPRWIARRIGAYTARCSLEFAPDDCRANDTLSSSFDVQEPTPWRQMADLPEGGRHKSTRGGAALVSDGTGLVYALKGNGTREFYAYHVTGDSWSRCCSIPRARRSTRGAALCYSPGADRVYAVSANSREFWEYCPKDNAWSRRADVPAGIGGRRPGLGIGLATMDTGLVYLLKGGGARELWAYEQAHDTWFRRAQAPASSSGKGYRTGSCMTAVRDYLYLVKGGCNEFFAYSTRDDTWYNRMPLPMTGIGSTRKTARAGAAMAQDRDVIYALKGGKCGELWWYDTFGDSWVEQRPVPLGPDWRPVADGGALAFAAGKLWALKGNNTREFWAYQPLAADRSPLAACRVRQVQSESAVHALQFAVGVHPNPFANNAMVFCSVPVAGELNLKLYDVNGRLVQTLWSGRRPAGAFSTVLTESLPLGVYLLRASTSTNSITSQLIHH